MAAWGASGRKLYGLQRTSLHAVSSHVRLVARGRRVQFSVSQAAQCHYCKRFKNLSIAMRKASGLVDDV